MTKLNRPSEANISSNRIVKLVLFLLLLQVSCFGAVWNLYDSDRSVFLLGLETRNQAIGIFCAILFFWSCYRIFLLFKPHVTKLTIQESSEQRLMQHQFASKYGPLGKTIFAALGLFFAVFFPYAIYSILTGQTVDEFQPHEAILFSIIILILMVWIVGSTLKVAFYQYTVMIDKGAGLIIHERSFLLWSTTSIYRFRDIQFVVSSDRKYINKYLAINVTYGSSNNKTPVYFLYLKPHGRKPILFMESKAWRKIKQKGKDLARLIGCRTYTHPPGSFLGGYW